MSPLSWKATGWLSWPAEEYQKGLGLLILTAEQSRCWVRSWSARACDPGEVSKSQRNGELLFFRQRWLGQRDHGRNRNYPGAVLLLPVWRIGREHRKRSEPLQVHRQELSWPPYSRAGFLRPLRRSLVLRPRRGSFSNSTRLILFQHPQTFGERRRETACAWAG
jgi:hypothetical protein